MTRREGIYVASRASVPERAAMWRDLRDNHGWNITASWIDEAGEGETADFTELWTRIHAEITRSDKLVLYARTEDFPLKGALIEVGIALGVGLPIVACLPFVVLEGRSMRPVGSWLAHPRVIRIDSLHDAMNYEPKEPHE